MEMTMGHPYKNKFTLNLVFRISLAAVVTLVLVQVFGQACRQKETVAPPSGLQQPICNKNTGYFEALETCTTTNVCTHLSEEFTKKGITQLTTPIIKPECRKAPGVDDDGEPYTTIGIDGTTRYACIHKPAGAGNKPLIIWFHAGGIGTAGDLYIETLLISKSANYDLGGTTNGFIIASVQGRTLHYPTDWPRDGYHHDFYFRSLKVPSENPDIAYTDHLIDYLVAQGGVDRNRIYVMGWSNGAMFSQLYAIARHEKTTPGGNKVAAAAVYSGGDPFHQINSVESPSCQLNPYPTSDAPIFIVRRACDAALACDSVQQGWFDTPPGHETETWLSEAPAKVGVNISSLTINGFSNPVSSCATTKAQCANAYGAGVACDGLNTDQCAELMAFVMHMRWPSGLREAGIDHEPTMLNFLRDNPHPNP